ncbi:MAG: restriction endonuclease subunit R [Oscillatoriales cyanobacterium RU_3_3]|nr:restriction endonuclease subunit R [Oscillatoriales cyanobacterium RU_3_3]NJR22605.1 restriction endonuclease subunit R [Richelia sp. CSU_2_1]
MTALNAKNLALSEVLRLLKFQKLPNGSFTPLLSLEPLTEFERQELLQTCDDFDSYLTDGKVSEGQVKLVSVGPLLRLAGFYRSPIKMFLEEGIADIAIEDEGATITGRLDLLAIDKNTLTTNIPFWILVIETKNSAIDVLAGLPQLLAYAYKNLGNQTSIWGLVTNGARYQFAYIQPGNLPTFQLMPLLNLMDCEPAIQILQVLKALCKLQNTALDKQS